MDNQTSGGNVTEVAPVTEGGATPDSYVVVLVHNIFAVVGIVSNLTVAMVFLNHRKLRRKIPNIFIINQSLIDCAVSLVLLLSTTTVRDPYLIHRDGVLGALECRLWNTKALLWGLFKSSTWNLVAMTIERHLELVHPIWHKTHFKKSWIYMCLVFTWLFGICFNFSADIPTTKVVSGKCLIYEFWPSALFLSVFGVCVVMVEFFIPLFILCYCYGRIVWVLSRRIDSKLDGTTTRSDKFQLARKNTIKTFLLISLCFILCWSCEQVLLLMFNLGYEVDFNSKFYNFSVAVAFGNCTVNPFIYLIKYQDFQKALKACIGCKNQEDKMEGSTVTTSVQSDSAL